MEEYGIAMAMSDFEDLEDQGSVGLMAPGR